MKYQNVCLTGRKAAGMTQEQWAEALGVSVKTVSNWECDVLMPSNWHVAQMVELTGSSYLAYLHLKQTSEVLDVLPDTETVPFAMAAIRLINKTLRFADNHRDRELLAIAEDGRIDETERPLFDAIMLELRELISAVYALRYAGEDKKRAPDWCEQSGARGHNA